MCHACQPSTLAGMNLHHGTIARHGNPLLPAVPAGAAGRGASSGPGTAPGTWHRAGQRAARPDATAAGPAITQP